MGLKSWLLESEKETMPVKELMSQRYKSLTQWLNQFDLTSDEIREILPEIYQDIQTAIERLDHALINQDMTAFQDALDRVRLFYTEAMLRCGRRVAVKIWSDLGYEDIQQKRLSNIQKELIYETT